MHFMVQLLLYVKVVMSWQLYSAGWNVVKLQVLTQLVCIRSGMVWPTYTCKQTHKALSSKFSQKLWTYTSIYSNTNN